MLEECGDKIEYFSRYDYQLKNQVVSREERMSMKEDGSGMKGRKEMIWIGFAILTNQLIKTFKRFGLTVNQLKSETMLINRNFDSNFPNCQKTIITLDTGITLKNTETFRYLGSKISENEPNTGYTEVNYRIQMANVKSIFGPVEYKIPILR